MDFFDTFGLLLLYAGGTGFAWFAMKLSGKTHATGTTLIASICGIVGTVGLILIGGSAAFDGGKTSLAFLGLYWFAAVGLVSYIKTKHDARQ